MKSPTPRSVKASMLNCWAAAAAAACAACSCGDVAGADMVNVKRKGGCPPRGSSEAKHGVNVHIHPGDPGVHFVLQSPRYAPITSAAEGLAVPCPLAKMIDSRPCYSLGCLIAPLTQWNYYQR